MHHSANSQLLLGISFEIIMVLTIFIIFLQFIFIYYEQQCCVTALKDEEQEAAAFTQKLHYIFPDGRPNLSRSPRFLFVRCFYVSISWKLNNKDKFSSSAEMMVIKKIFEINLLYRESAPSAQ